MYTRELHDLAYLLFPGIFPYPFSVYAMSDNLISSTLCTKVRFWLAFAVCGCNSKINKEALS